MDILEHKGYYGNLAYSTEDKIFHGKVQGIRTCLLYEGYTFEEIKEDFENTIDSYLDMCSKNGTIPEKPSPYKT